MVCKTGQIVTGRKSLSQECGVSEMKVERWLSVLETAQQIEQQKTNKYRIITIKNWSYYQSGEQQFAQQMNNRCTTDEQQMNTNKNDKNDKNEKKSVANTPAEKMRGFVQDENQQQEIIQKLVERGVPRDIAEREIQKFISYWTELNKSGTRQRWEMQKTFEINRRLATWFNNISQFKKSSYGRGTDIIS